MTRKVKPKKLANIRKSKRLQAKLDNPRRPSWTVDAWLASRPRLKHRLTSGDKILQMDLLVTKSYGSD